VAREYERTFMRRLRNVKIVATLGPASDTYEMIRALHEAGADVFRLNMSHGTHDELREKHRIIRQVEKDLDRPIAILADLQGPKLRVGTFAEDERRGSGRGRALPPRPGRGRRATHAGLPAASRDLRRPAPGATLLVNDGKIRLKVDGPAARFRRMHRAGRGHDLEPQGRERARRGAAAGRVVAKGPRDLEFACGLGVDWLALSFVQRPEDVIRGADPRGRARRDPVEDRKARRGRTVRRHPGGVRRDHGRARRSGRGTAGPGRAADPETSGAQVPRWRRNR
jgi:pyruvate kinase